MPLSADKRQREKPVAALTGATGFLGRHLVPALAAQGYKVRILTRRDPVHPLWADIEIDVVPGVLEDRAALERLVEGAAVVVHAAGLIKARGRADFLQVNRDGTARLARLVEERVPDAYFLLISSLAARCPELSFYAESKRAGELAAIAARPPGRLGIVRPPAIYGPGDLETLTLFKLARGILTPLAPPGEGRAALIHVDDAARAIAVLARAGIGGGSAHWTLADPVPAGYSMREILTVAATALGSQPKFVQMPKTFVHALGVAGEAWAAMTGQAVMLTRGKAREICHADWGVRPEELPPADLWQPSIAMQQGIAATARWYRDQGLL